MAVPPLPVADYQTRGLFPQVTGAGISLTAVNSALSNSLHEDQSQYAVLARQHETAQPVAIGESDPGIYAMYPDPKLISASSVVVSALIGDTHLFPGGTDSNGWFGVTVQVPSGSPVAVDQLFATPAGLAALAAAAKASVLMANNCVKAGLDDPTVGTLNAAGFEPTIRNYSSYALVPEGVAIGFQDEQVGAAVCGSPEVVVPYSIVEPYLSALGARLVAGVRQPQH
jgi:hypothetical protein